MIRSAGRRSMTALATVSPPTPESKIPIGASMSEGTARSLGAEDRGGAGSSVGPRNEPRGQQPGHRAEQVRLPGDARLTGEDAEQDAAPDHEQRPRPQDMWAAAGEDPGAEQKPHPAEDQPRRTDRGRVCRADEPHPEPAEQPDHGGH